MGRLLQEHIVRAMIRVANMSPAEKKGVEEEIRQAQPNLLASVRSLRQAGLSPTEFERLLELLLTFFEAMRDEGNPWPLIPESVQAECQARVVARLQAAHDSSAGLLVLEDEVEAYPERPLLALAVTQIHLRGPERSTGAAGEWVLCALNLVEAIAWAGQQGTAAASSALTVH